jgi:hypothetical protein
MKHFVNQPHPVLHELTCDRCGVRHAHPGSEFFEFTSIAYRAGYGSIFGDGNQVEVDLCQSCLKDTLGPWLRVEEEERAVRLRGDLAAFDPEAHGGEGPSDAPRHPRPR